MASMRVPGGGLGIPGVPNIGDAVPVGKTLEIQQSAREIQISNKEVNGGHDLVEVFKLDGKDKVELIDTGGGYKLKRVTKVKLAKYKLAISTKTIIPGSNPIISKREFKLDNGRGLKLRITGGISEWSAQLQNLYYN